MQNTKLRNAKKNKGEPNLTSFCTIKKRTRDFYPSLKRKRSASILETYPPRWINQTLFIVLTNMYPNPSWGIFIKTYSVDLFFLCQEPDLNWWHEDFQSSALPTELSWPFLVHHPSRVFVSMSIKGTQKSIKVFQIPNWKMGGWSYALCMDYLIILKNRVNNRESLRIL